eukprot:3626011-Pyramimonas_sp.AAC.1
MTYVDAFGISRVCSHWFPFVLLQISQTPPGGRACVQDKQTGQPRTKSSLTVFSLNRVQSSDFPSSPPHGNGGQYGQPGQWEPTNQQQPAAQWEPQAASIPPYQPAPNQPAYHPEQQSTADLMYQVRENIARPRGHARWTLRETQAIPKARLTGPSPQLQTRLHRHLRSIAIQLAHCYLRVTQKT